MNISVVVGVLLLILAGRLVWNYFRPIKMAGNAQDIKKAAMDKRIWIISGLPKETILIIGIVIGLLGLWMVVK